MQVDVTPDISFPYSLPILWTSPEMRDRPLTVPSFIARVRAGVTLQEAKTEIEALWSSALADSMPVGFAAAEEAEMRRLRIHVEPAGNGFSSLRTSYAPVLYAFVALTGVLLALASVNIGGQLLARTADREQELAILSRTLTRLQAVDVGYEPRDDCTACEPRRQDRRGNRIAGRVEIFVWQPLQ